MHFLETLTVPGQPPVRVAARPRAHLIGIAGAGMRSLAEVLDEAGWRVSGSDLHHAASAAPYPVRCGHDAGLVDASVELVVYSNAVAADNVELSRARELGIPAFSYPQMLGHLMQSYRGLAFAGTHGKSTAAAMAGEIFTAAGFDPTVVVGAAPIGSYSGGRHGQGPWMIVEACEYCDSFRHLKPELAAILNIEPDHFDYFASPAELERAFGRFAGSLPAAGLLMARAECPASRRACAERSCSLETFGLVPTADWWAGELRERGGYYAFRLYAQQRVVCDVKLPVPGVHNVANAVAAAALASHCGAPGAAIREGLERFVGLRRRLQLLGEVRDVALVDDYAHHPTEVAASLAALRQMYPGRRLWCVFEPHQASRLAPLLDQFAASLAQADKIVLADVFRAREGTPAAGEISSEHLGARLAAGGADVIQLASAAQIRDHLNSSVKPGDVLVTMGAGEIGRVAHELGQGLRTFRKTG